MSNSFYPFVDSGDAAPGNSHITGMDERPLAASENADAEQVRYPARIAVYDDMLSTPRIVVIEAKDIRSYLEDVTNTVSKLAKEQGSGIPFMVIREIVENFIHASFIEPTVSILDGGNTIRFADQGPGIQNKELALEPGMTSADAHMKRYIRGVGSGFPTVQQYLDMICGTLSIEDNMGGGTVVTVTIDADRMSSIEEKSTAPQAAEEPVAPQPPTWAPQGGAMPWSQPPMQQPWMAQPAPYGYPHPQSYGFPQSYPQAAPMFSTPPQAAVSPAPSPDAPQGQVEPYISERGLLALRFIQENGPCGPTDLMHAAGRSNATWSRELATLANTGLVIKRGQKYHLTELGRNWGIQ